MKNEESAAGNITLKKVYPSYIQALLNKHIEKSIAEYKRELMV